MIAALVHFLMRLVILAAAVVAGAGAVVAELLDRPGAAFWTSDRGTCTAAEAMWGGLVLTVLLGLLYLALRQTEGAGWPPPPSQTRHVRRVLRLGRRAPLYDD